MNVIEYTGFGLIVGIAFLPAFLSSRGIGRIVLAMLLSFAFLPGLFFGGVVTQMKFDDGYWVLLRGSPDDWVETNLMLYYMHKLYPWVYFGCVVVVLAIAWRRRRSCEAGEPSR